MWGFVWWFVPFVPAEKIELPCTVRSALHFSDSVRLYSVSSRSRWWVGSRFGGRIYPKKQKLLVWLLPVVGLSVSKVFSQNTVVLCRCCVVLHFRSNFSCPIFPDSPDPLPKGGAAGGTENWWWLVLLVRRNRSSAIRTSLIAPLQGRRPSNSACVCVFCVSCVRVCV